MDALRVTNKKKMDFCKSIIETLEIMADKDLMKALRKGIKEANEGKGIPWEKVKKDLGLL